MSEQELPYVGAIGRQLVPDGDTETLWELRAKIKATLHMEANYGIGDMCSFYDRLGNAVMPLVEEFTRLAVETALTEQRKAIAWEIQDLSPATSAPDRYRDGMLAAVAIVRDFGKEGA